jgi:hypothetical protein
MFGNSRRAAHGILAASLTGLITLTAAPALASAAAPGAAGPAATARSAPMAGSYGSWRAAQRAAGFRLKAPARTYGLTRKHPILVGKCLASGRHTKRDVYAEWDGSHLQYLTLDQNNSGGACSNFGAARFLGTYRVQGRRARLYGFCGSRGLPSCRAKGAVLVLTWRQGKRYYVAYSSHEWRATLLGFARHLRYV